MWLKGSAHRTFWIEQPWLMAGAYPFDQDESAGIEKLEKIVDDGIRTFLNLTEPGELNNWGIPLIDYAPYLKVLSETRDVGLKVLNIPIPDGGAPSREIMDTILDLLYEHQKSGTPIFVHCWGGRGRTGTVIATWLKEPMKISGEETIQMLEDENNTEPAGPWVCEEHGGPEIESFAQEQFVKNF